ncbi:DEAD box ATP-dependent RNA helicase, putative [Plasmodium gallinaceum]|uniref:ATP-dependent RNA helicase n=1 Tax=Plasmodium gallinaceum TaxID=5849 RepID=A0A1J1H3X2_PLAGA|nr:DEAD box ATP-dependent RNA helicase, putative [Plasmodium gallinaceum]CRG98183.1 DEAD box ATP-dependent RNA helicase, putative [Plasmodium gallinaceum]
MVLINNIKNVVKYFKFFDNAKIYSKLLSNIYSNKVKCYNQQKIFCNTFIGKILSPIEIENKKKEKEIKNEIENNYLIEFIDKEKKIIYDNFNDLNELCLKKFKKLKCDLYLLTSSNREYVPYYFYDFFLSYNSSQKGDNLSKNDILIKFNNIILENEQSCYNNSVIDKNLYIDESNSPKIITNEEYNKKIDNKKMKKNNILIDNNEIEKNYFLNLYNLNDRILEFKDNIVKKKMFTYYESLLQYKDISKINIDSYIKLSIQKNFNIKYLTTVQYCLFPFFLKNFDLLINSSKSTGKTLAYCIALIHKIIIQINNLKKMCMIKENYIYALIICPNIILVEQTYKIIKKLIIYHPYKLKCHYIHGRKNINMKQELDEMKKKKPHIIVTTPVSFINHIKFSKGFSKMFFLCDTIIIDEAYFLLDSNYLKNILIIKNILPKGHQTILLSSIVNNFLKHLAYRFSRLNYVYLNLVDNSIYDSNLFYSSSHMNIVNSNSEEKLSHMEYIKSQHSTSYELYNKLNYKLLSIYKNNILNCTDVRKLWHSKDAKTFYENINLFNSYIVNNEVNNIIEQEDYNNSYINEMSNQNDINYFNETIRHNKKNTNEEINDINKKINSVFINNISCGSDSKKDDNESNEKPHGNIAINNDKKTENIKENFFEEYAFDGFPNEEDINGKLKLDNSDYNNYIVSSNNNYDETKGRNLPTHILLKQEYLIYETDKLALILFNIIQREFLLNENMKIVIFMPTVKMLQFFYVIFKHYIFKGYIFLLYLKLNKWKKNENIIDNSYYYDKENVNFCVSSNPFISTNNYFNNVSFNLERDTEEFKNTSMNQYNQENLVNKLNDKKITNSSNSSKENNITSNILNEEKQNTLKKEMDDENREYINEFEKLKDIVILCLHSKLSLDKKIYTLNCFNNSQKKKQILFSTSLLYQGIQLDKVDLVIQVGISINVDEYILRTQIATTKNTQGRSLLLLNELEGHFLYTLYKNNILISNVSKKYLNYIYKDNPFLNILLKYKKPNNNNIILNNQKEPENAIDIIEKKENNYDHIKKKNQENFDNFYKFHIKHIEWHKHNHLLSSCELMYRSLLGFYSEKSKYLKYEKWQIPSLIKNILHSFGYFDNFYITKCMATRLQILNAPDVYINVNAKSKSVLMSALPSYKSYKSKMNELKYKNFSKISSFNLSNEEKDICKFYNSHYSHINNNQITENETKNDSGKNEDMKKEKYEKSFMEKYPLYFPIHKYLS